ncbi:HAD family hydrolase [Paenibacillus sp. M1]|uniref:HAD family hydrolase n=1 Tax=Paenibacillus haidiansis TaxID=1574488 RepID=A0ABU7VMU4_9BACL
MERIKAVLFDLDNTLMDRDWTFSQFARQLVSERLSVGSPEEMEKLVAYMIESDADGYRPKEGFFREMIENLSWTAKPDLTELKAYYDKNYMTHARVMNHAVEALEACRGLGLKLGVITNGFSHLQHGKIDLLNLRAHFDAIVVSGDIGIKKPDERIYRIALEKLGTAPEETIIVGDHPRNDIWGASRVGIRGVWLLRKHAWSDDLAGGEPWRTINELNELAPLLENWCRTAE